MTPDQIRRSWDDDDTPRSVFPEPLAERLTRENKQLRAENERVAATALTVDRELMEARAEVERLREDARTAWNVHAEHVEMMNLRLLHEASAAADWKARLDALVADLRGLAERWGKAEPVVGYPGYDDAYRDAEQEVRAVLDKHAGGK